MSLAYWIHTPLAQALGRTLAHFVWEGALLAAVLMALLHAVPARRRYALACVILAGMPLAFAATFATIWMRRPVAVAMPLNWVTMPASVSTVAIPIPRSYWAALLDRLPWLVPAWVAGVLFFYARGLAGWAAVQRLRRRGVCSPPSEWQQRLDRLGARLRIARPVMLLESCLTDTPVLIGYLRPVILLPLGCLTGLSTAQVECILLHELAHVARHDYLVNLLQSVVEGLLFYHPAVWWASHVVRTEREHCCDDRVVELVGNARAYAATLAMLEQRRALAPALAASGGNLMNRIRRLTADSGNAPVSAAPAISAGLLLVMFAAAVAAVPAKPRIVRPALLAIAVQEPARTPYQRWLDEDVVYIITNEERAAFQKLTTDNEREQFTKDFWEHRGQPLREEHYRRIAYANEHFSRDIPGWKTDSGRMYVIYGPPDGIEGQARKMVWTYRHLDGIGDNVEVDFEDPQGTGDFRMTTAESNKKRNIYQDLLDFIANQERAVPQKRPQERLRQAALLQEDPKVSIIMGSKVISPGDVLDIAYRTARYVPPLGMVPFVNHFLQEVANKQAECASVQKKWPGFPAAQECLSQLQALMNRTGGTLAELKAPRFDLPGQSEAELELTRPQTLEVDRKLAKNLTMQIQLQDNLAAPYPSRITVNHDGRIALDGRQLMAAGMTTAQLEAAIGPGASVRIDGSAAQLVTIIVPLSSTRDQFHVLAEVTVNQKIVQAFEDDVNGQQSVAKTVGLRLGTYQLKVDVKNIATGVTKTSTLDFTVE